jgi:hypothetical protein
MLRYSAATEPPPTKVEGFSGLERLRRTVGSFPTEVGGFKPDFWKMNQAEYDGLIVLVPVRAML